MTDEKLIELLKLKKKITENYTVMTEKNTVRTFDSVNDILWEYIRVKKEYTKKRKSFMIKNISDGIRLDVSRYVFIKSIQNETLVINKRNTEDIINDIKKIDKIIPKDSGNGTGSGYDYLLQMGINSLTKDRMEKLIHQIKSQKAVLDKIKAQTIEEIWLDEL